MSLPATEAHAANPFCKAALLVAALLAAEATLAQVKPPAPAPPPVRAGGLTVGPAGLTVGPGGGLAAQYQRNYFPATLPPLPADAPEPNPDPRVLEGSYQGEQYVTAWEIQSDMYGNEVPFNETGRKVTDQRLLAADRGSPYITPAIICRSAGPVRDLIRTTFQIFESKDKIDILSNAGRTWWQIPLNPSLAAPAGEKTYVGRSIGRWEGDTLVVETTDFKHRLYLSFRGTPLSTKGKLTTRIRKVHEDRWFLEMVTTVNDPTFYKRPWSFVRTFAWRPDNASLGEEDCEMQAGDKTNDPGAGFTHEPNEF